MPVLPGDTRVCHCRHSAVFCQPCQGCLMCLSLVQVCARLGPPASSGNVFFAQGTSVSLQLVGDLLSCQLGSQCAMPVSPQLLQPACLAPCHQLHLSAPAREGLRPPWPLVHCPTLFPGRPWTSRGSFAMKMSLPWAAVYPQEHFGGNLVFTEEPEEEREASGSHRLARHQSPRGVDCAAPSFEAQSPPWHPHLHSCTGLGGSFGSGSGRTEAGQFPPRQSPHHFLWQ